MTVTVADLVERSGLSLRALVAGLGSSISWVHSSDLPDPTPFLAADQLLLTTGTQFRDHEADAYVQRLVDAGVAGLGLGTGITWPSPPAELVEACEQRGLALIEVPYAVPFIAVSRWVVDELSAQAHARDAWSVSAQRTISLAALSARRLGGVLDELARQLGGQVLLFDAHAELVSRHGAGRFTDLADDEITRDARTLIRRNTRAGGATTGPDATVTLQTLGRRDHLRGVLATVTEDPVDAAANAVIVAAVALTELSMEDTARQQAQQAEVDGQLLRLLVEGERPAVERILAGTGRTLPREPLRVIAHRPGAAPEPTGRIGLSAAYDGLSVMLVSEEDLAVTLAGLDDLRLGVSRQSSYGTLPAAIAGARAALDRSSAERRVVADDDRPVLGLLPRSEVTGLARARLRGLLDAPDAGELVRTTETWLRHNAAYDPAARELGMHRHTVKAQLQRVQELVDLDLDSFAGKAELWALLQSR